MYLGLDLGASYCKAALIDLKKKVARCERVEMPPFLSSSSKSHLIYEVDICKITDVVIGLIKRIAEASKYSIEAIGIAGQMHGIVLVDKSKVPLSNFISWQDQRTTETMPGKQFSYLDFVREGLSSYRLITGTDLRPGMLGPLLFWWKSKGYIGQKHYKVSFLSDYLVSLLTDTDIVCDPTQAAGSGVYNLLENTWLKEFVQVTEIPEEILPQVVESGTKVGGICSAIARTLGIQQGTPVYVSTGDYHAALFASGINTRSLSINIGTGAQVSLLTRAPKYSKNFETRPFFDSYYTNCISGLPGGRAISLFEDFINDTIRMFSECSVRFEILKRLDELCVKRFQKTDIVCDPHFFDAGNGLSRSGFFHINYHNFKIEEFYKALLEGLVREYFEAFNVLSTTGNIPRDLKVILSGGVVQKSVLLRKIIKNIFGFEVVLPKYKEEAAVGAALLARKYSCGDNVINNF